MNQKSIREFVRIILEEENLDSAQILSQWAHHGQKRRSGEPYFLHPQEVANIITQYYDDEETYYAAMLHDALEDGIPLGNIKDEQTFFDILAGELPEASVETIDKIYNSIGAYETLSELKKQKLIDFKLIYKRLNAENNCFSYRRKFVSIINNIKKKENKINISKKLF